MGRLDKFQSSITAYSNISGNSNTQTFFKNIHSKRVCSKFLPRNLQAVSSFAFVPYTLRLARVKCWGLQYATSNVLNQVLTESSRTFEGIPLTSIWDARPQLLDEALKFNDIGFFALWCDWMKYHLLTNYNFGNRRKALQNFLRKSVNVTFVIRLVTPYHLTDEANSRNRSQVGMTRF